MKKKLFFLLLGLAWLGQAGAQTATVSGHCDNGQKKGLTLYQVRNGSTVEMAKATTDSCQQFNMEVTPVVEGYYALRYGAGKQAVFYLKPGDSLQLDITSDGYQLTGKNNTPENRELARWHDFILPMEEASRLPASKKISNQEFFSLLENKRALLKKNKAGKTKNKSFDASFADFRQIDFLDKAMRYVMTPRPSYPKDEEYTDYFRNPDLAALTRNTALLNYPDGIRLMVYAFMLKTKLSSSLSEENRQYILQKPDSELLRENNEIVNDTIKGELVLAFAENNKTALGMKNFEKRYGHYLMTEDQRERFNRVKKTYDTASQATDMTGFAFPNQSGDTVSISDFRGRVVYIDIWATWCGPCKKEMPFLKKLEERYRNNDGIVFVGVSIDTPKNKETWEKFITQEQLPGIQLFAGESGQKFLKSYNIKGIPRFMLVDKAGKLIYNDAPRPSSDEIYILLDDILRK